ncbi:MAG TPA: ATP-binding protein, partial [Isosphaeraceae bacterium]|nr:ATP-binding protein [Isosphaeraceae bacterium]
MDRRETQPNQVTSAETASKPILLPSRQDAIGQLQAAVERGLGPVLLTGEPGSGKTWLINQWIARTTTPSLRWVSVDMPPGASPVDLLTAVASALGLVVEPGSTASSLRITLSRLFAEQAVDERRWGLVVDEAHLGNPEVLEELRILSNRMRQSEGFWAIVLVGQTALIRHLSAWPMRGLEARLSRRIHLGPIDADEARLLLGPAVSVLDAERRHRDSEGNPGRLLRLDGPARRPLPWSAARRARLVADEAPPQAEPKARAEKPAPASLLPSRPPLRVEDGVIEVGWDA